MSRQTGCKLTAVFRSVGLAVFPVYFVLGVAGCRGGLDEENTGVVLRVVGEEGAEPPARMVILWSNGERLLLERTLPETGAGVLRFPVVVRVAVPSSAIGPRYVVARGQSNDQIVSEVAAAVEIIRGAWQEMTLVLGTGRVADLDGDGWPEGAGPCPRETTVCGPRPDASVVARDGGGEPLGDAGDAAAGDFADGAGETQDGRSEDGADDGEPQPQPDSSADDASGPPIDGAAGADADGDTGAVSSPEGPLPDAEVPDSPPLAPTGTGLKGEYFEDLSFRARRLTRVDPQIDLNWESGSPGTGVPTNQFTVRWTGDVVPPTSETYTFYTRADDRARLWVDGVLLADGWMAPVDQETSGAVRLTAGRRYPVRLEFAEDSGIARVRLSWSTPTRAKSVVARQFLFPAP